MYTLPLSNESTHCLRECSEEALPQALKWLPPPPASQLRHMSKADARDGGASGGMAVACALQRAMMNVGAGGRGFCGGGVRRHVAESAFAVVHIGSHGHTCRTHAQQGCTSRSGEGAV